MNFDRPGLARLTSQPLTYDFLFSIIDENRKTLQDSDARNPASYNECSPEMNMKRYTIGRFILISTPLTDTYTQRVTYQYSC